MFDGSCVGCRNICSCKLHGGRRITVFTSVTGHRRVLNPWQIWLKACSTKMELALIVNNSWKVLEQLFSVCHLVLMAAYFSLLLLHFTPLHFSLLALSNLHLILQNSLFAFCSTHCFTIWKLLPPADWLFLG